MRIASLAHLAHAVKFLRFSFCLFVIFALLRGLHGIGSLPGRITFCQHVHLRYGHRLYCTVLSLLRTPLKVPLPPTPTTLLSCSRCPWTAREPSDLAPF
ncbi:hypothetical protein F4782DRAFT_412514 [Xylaria castorea]|nr:hypothetical protein F4782DRAFT_412514 [Xylaria castorea]